MTTKVAGHKSGTFIDQVISNTPGGERLVHCIQCGTCGGSCPSGADMEHTPRAIINMIRGGERATVLGSNMIWACVSCYYCTSRCPQEIPITDIIYTCKRLSIAEKAYRDTDAPALAQAFTHFVDKYGRSFEAGLATRYHLLNRPFKAMAMGPMGLGMFTRGRMAIFPAKIKNVEQLQKIIAKAREIGAKHK